jgi:peptide/nickel transport system permease protein
VQHLSTWQMAWKRLLRHRTAVLGAVVLSMMLLIVIVGPILLGKDAAIITRPDAIMQPPSREFIFGTDTVGRDLFARCLQGGRISLTIGVVAALIAMVIGTILGSLAGYYGGWIDILIMRFTDVMLSIPRLFFMIAVTRIVAGGVISIIVVVGFLNWMTVARVVRANFLAQREQDYVQAARALGVRDSVIIFKHIMPNVMGPVIVSATLGVGQAILLEASASFLGLGIQPPAASWGSMLYRAQPVLSVAPWVAWFPGLMILVTILCINFLGDGLRDALDPKTEV